MKLQKYFGIALGLLLLLVVAIGLGAEPEIDLGKQIIPEQNLVVVPAAKPPWMTIGAPLLLLAAFFGLVAGVFKWIPFRETPIHFNLHYLPVAAQRGIGMAVVLFGISFVFAGFEVHYQMTVNGSIETYFQQMSAGKLIAITHAHLTGLTTSFFIIGIPFSLHFNRLMIYQLIFPLGLAAVITDIISWWGIKYISGNFEYVTWWCGAVFFVSYMWMLIGLVRTIFFPRVRWFVDAINEGKEPLK